MTTPSKERPSNRRAGDRADRQSRTTRLTLVVVAAVAVAVLAGGYWWYGRQDASRDGAPSWFPDGRALVFAAEMGAEKSDIFRMDLDGGGRRVLAPSPANDSAPTVSPDGSLIAFESDRDGNDEIYVMSATGSDVRRLTNDPAEDRSPAWSPDGRRLAFTSDRDSRASADVYVMNADGSGVERLTSDQAHWAPQFSPDGRSIAVQVNRDVEVRNLTTGDTRRLTSAPQNGMNPTWSPDGTALAFVTTRNGRAEIFRMHADGSGQEVLVSMARGLAIDPRWSPDGARIAFVLVPATTPDAADTEAPEDLQAIYTVEIATGVVTRLSR